MKILVTNDDGILADGLWALVSELKKIAQVVVAAPDREQSAIGTAVSLRHPLRVKSVRPLVPGVETYSVEGTPADSVILALSKMVADGVDVVVSGINDGLNLGDDVLISGTVSGALQGYLRRAPAIAISLEAGSGLYLDNAAKLARLLVEKIHASALPTSVFLNVNLPALPLSKTRGAKITRLARYSHIDTVEEGNRGKWKHYWLVRQQRNRATDNKADIWAIDHGYISITPLHINSYKKTSYPIIKGFCDHLLQELRQ